MRRWDTVDPAKEQVRVVSRQVERSLGTNTPEPEGIDPAVALAESATMPGYLPRVVLRALTGVGEMRPAKEVFEAASSCSAASRFNWPAGLHSGRACSRARLSLRYRLPRGAPQSLAALIGDVLPRVTYEVLKPSAAPPVAPPGKVPVSAAGSTTARNSTLTEPPAGAGFN